MLEKIDDFKVKHLTSIDELNDGLETLLKACLILAQRLHQTLCNRISHLLVSKSTTVESGTFLVSLQKILVGLVNISLQINQFTYR